MVAPPTSPERIDAGNSISNALANDILSAQCASLKGTMVSTTGNL